MYAVYFYNAHVHSYLPVKDKNTHKVKLFNDLFEAEEEAEFVYTNFSSKVYVAEIELPDKIHSESNIRSHLTIASVVGEED